MTEDPTNSMLAREETIFRLSGASQIVMALRHAEHFRVCDLQAALQVVRDLIDEGVEELMAVDHELRQTRRQAASDFDTLRLKVAQDIVGGQTKPPA